jgi:hypothetical protein
MKKLLAVALAIAIASPALAATSYRHARFSQDPYAGCAAYMGRNDIIIENPRDWSDRDANIRLEERFDSLPEHE